MKKTLSFASIGLIAALGSTFSFHLGEIDVVQRAAAERGQVEVELSAVRARLDGHIRGTFGITQGLVDVIAINGGITPDLFAQMAALCIEKSRNIRNIAIAPEDTISDIYPHAGNEKAIGLRYATIPSQYQTVLRARRLGAPVLSDVVNLVQGGQALIQRSPVFLRHSSDKSGARTYWGMVSIVAHMDDLFSATGVSSSETLNIALAHVDETGKQNILISGDATLAGQAPVLLNLEVPGATWQLSAIPRAGWTSLTPWTSLHFLFGIAITLLLSLIASILLVNSHKLQLRNRTLLQEVRERKRAEEGLRLADAVYKSTDQGIVVTDGLADIVSVNRAFTEITGYGPLEISGCNFRTLCPEATEPSVTFNVMWATLEKEGVWQGELNCLRKSGEIFPCWLTISVIDNAPGKALDYVIVLSDISPLIRTQVQLEHMAHYDPLTDLPNRLLFQDRLSQALKRRNRGNTLTALLLLDLDGFKMVNDSHGHPIGDKLLQSVSRRLKACVREEDTVARLGGDEFALILDRVTQVDGVVHVANSVLAAIATPFDLNGVHAEISTSIGIAFYPIDADNTVELIRNADTAMYGAKEQGRNKFSFYQASMTQATQLQMQLGQAMRKGLEQNEFEVWYQPQISLSNGELTGAEALLRWHRKDAGMVPPNEFIPLAERTGLIIPLGEFVLQQVCSDGRAWLDADVTFGKLAVNVATPQIERSDFVSTLVRILGKTGFPAQNLEIEVTESVIMASADVAQSTMNAIQKMGISTAIDDFGTGYSSLAYLKELPIDNLKIDRAFIKDLPGKAQDATITRAIISLGHSLGFRVIAEGIETEAQWRFLRDEGCDEIQGYWVARPMPAADFLAWVKNHRS